MKRLFLLALLLSGCRTVRTVHVDAQTPEGVRCAFNCSGEVECMKRCPGVYLYRWECGE